MPEYMNYSSDAADTIAAISTGLTPSGIGKVRVSGPGVKSIARKLFLHPGGRKGFRDEEDHTIQYGHITEAHPDRDGNVRVIDEVLLMIMLSPRSYTKEDMIEIDCHGGVLIMQRILEAVISAGARPAEPGEFTKRAFLNGRIDLSQAESVMDLIQSKSDMARSAALANLQGGISSRIRPIRSEMIGRLAFIEAALDDPEHISLEGFYETLYREVMQWLDQLRKMSDEAGQGKLIREGIDTVILGKPNAGKSSLLNAMLGEERAIVTDIPGTTRDTLSEYIRLDEITLHLVDTAGIRKTQDTIEQIGVSRALTAADRADLLLFVTDGSRQLDEDDEEIIALIQEGKLPARRVIVLVNKSDLPEVTGSREMSEKLPDCPVFYISAHTREGLDALTDQIRKMFFEGKIGYNDQVWITSVRQKEAVDRACESLGQVLVSMDQAMPEDFLSIDLMQACETLGEITGETAGEDVINRIFSEFCMGK